MRQRRGRRTKSSLGGAESSVEHVDVGLLGLSSLLKTASDLERSRLCRVEVGERLSVKLYSQPELARFRERLTVVSCTERKQEEKVD
jgi:hypothetical protein